MIARLSGIARNRITAQRRRTFARTSLPDIEDCSNVYGEASCDHEPTCDENFGPPYCKKCGVAL